MFEWRSVFLTLGLISLCFIGIPIKIEKLKAFKPDLSFKSYLETYNKTYLADSEEYEKHLKTFEVAKKQWEELNKYKNSSDLAFYGLTKFADISQEDFSKRYLRHINRKKHNKTMKSNPKTIKLLRMVSGAENLPKKVDWREHGVVSKIKDQGICGACWAFSVVSVAESMAALKSRKLQELSVQEMIDCAGNGNLGCNGGDTCSLLEWLVDNKISIESEKDYPLVLKNEVCKIKVSLKGERIAPNYFCQSFTGSESNLLAILANHGPVTVAVNALSWQYYLGGVIRFNCDNSVEKLNHAVVIVGYDLTVTTPYYIVRNSWGPRFGENGYLKIAVGENVCGIAHEVTIFDVL